MSVGLISWRSILPPPFASPADVPPAWDRYLVGVYGETVPAGAFPLDVGQFDMLYERLLPAAVRHAVAERPLLGATSANASDIKPEHALHRVPRRRRERRLPHDAYSLWPSSTLAFAYHYRDHPGKKMGFRASDEPPRLVHGHPDFAKVEVMHCYEDADDFYWLYAATGSGVYYDVGRTYVAKDAFAMWRDTGVNQSRMLKHHYRGRRVCRTISEKIFEPGFYCVSRSEDMHQSYRMTRRALATLIERGYDSVQLTRTQEHGIHKFELIDLRPHRRVHYRCYDRLYHERMNGFHGVRGCAYKRGAASDQATFEATPGASACPTNRTAVHNGSVPAANSTAALVPRGPWQRPPLEYYSTGWAGARGVCRCSMRASRCLNCAGMSPLTRER